MNRIRPSKAVKRHGQGFTAMSATHDVNVGHGNHHLNGDRHPTAAQGIKRRHLIALRPFVQAVGEHLSERLVLSIQQVSAAL
jgi:hypothetical protein